MSFPGEQQMDWITFEDEGAQLDMLLLASVERCTIAEVAKHLKVTPSHLRNIVAGRRTMLPGTFSICWRLDPIFRAACAALKKEVLSRPPDLTPEQSLREIVTKAQAKGFVALEDVAALYARTRTGDV